LRKILKEKVNKPIEILNYIKGLESFPNACIVYRILLTILITVVTVERSFSKLKLFKSYLRSTMLQDRLNELALLSIKNERLELLDYKTLINDFAAQKSRRLI